MRIEKLISKKGNLYNILDDKNNFLARYDDLITASAVMRYVQGAEVTEFERNLVLSTIFANDNVVLSEIDLPVHSINAFYVHSNKFLFIPKDNSADYREKIIALIEADKPPKNCVLTLITEGITLQYCCLK